ncbi:aryl-alcohol dehydrogenase-like predicted oxidoreductase [Novosphingobium sp. PhB165]|uniref:aldo/keto reductase n=1 Tax=Novosphingobium sp. PhB165 TaxID=2485105 RepID=UPI0010532602|nr:aldo/keto reductase [Novosphingobium sp. PhB165]TCM21998.1 aryl-alcohol dehydrogenase-like predicted oxidoreductase [Novosphingobium sp. PhB165]
MADTVPVAHAYIDGIPLVLGGNVFGWTIDRDRSFAVLDAFYEAGGRMIDTAEGYSNWVPGHKGGESEAIIGEWLQARGVRSEMRIATKTGQGGAPGSLIPEKVCAALDGSLERLRTDYVDLFYAHRDDGTTPLDEVAAVYGDLFHSGRARELGASNYTAERLAAVIDAADTLGVQHFTVLQPLYNLVARDEFEGPLMALCQKRGIAALPYYGLAAGFLTGKYSSAGEWEGTTRAHSLDAAAAHGGWAILDDLRAIAADSGASPAQVALAWLNAQPTIAAPIASATSPEQVRELVGAARLILSDECFNALNTHS